jgi:hypothetical protein
MSTATESPKQSKLDLPKLVSELRRLLEINRDLSPTETDALCELRLLVRRELLNLTLQKR